MKTRSCTNLFLKQRKNKVHFEFAMYHLLVKYNASLENCMAYCRQYWKISDKHSRVDTGENKKSLTDVLTDTNNATYRTKYMSFVVFILNMKNEISSFINKLQLRQYTCTIHNFICYLP